MVGTQAVHMYSILQDFVVDAKLSHFAMGFNLSNQIRGTDV